MSVTYNEYFDILLVELTDGSNSYGDEEPNNFVVFRNMDTEEITGYQIMDFGRMVETKGMDYIRNLPWEGLDFGKRVLQKAKKVCDFLAE